MQQLQLIIVVLVAVVNCVWCQSTCTFEQNNYLYRHITTGVNKIFAIWFPPGNDFKNSPDFIIWERCMLTSSVRVNDHNSSFKFKSTIFGEFSKTFLKSRHQSSSNEPFFGEVFQNSPKSCHHSSSNQQFSWKFCNFPKPCYRSSKSFKSTIFGIF